MGSKLDSWYHERTRHGVAHGLKKCLEPSTAWERLGIVVDSVSMRISGGDIVRELLHTACNSPTTRDTAALLRKLNAVDVAMWMTAVLFAKGAEGHRAGPRVPCRAKATELAFPMLSRVRLRLAVIVCRVENPVAHRFQRRPRGREHQCVSQQYRRPAARCRRYLEPTIALGGRGRSVEGHGLVRPLRVSSSWSLSSPGVGGRRRRFATSRRHFLAPAPHSRARGCRARVRHHGLRELAALQLITCQHVPAETTRGPLTPLG